MGIDFVEFVFRAGDYDCTGNGCRRNQGTGKYSNLYTNTPEVLILDFAAYYNRAVIVPLYPTSSVEQVEYILNETEARYIFVGEQAQYDNALLAMKNCAALRQIVVLDKHVKLSAEDTQSIYFMDFMAIGTTADAAAAEEVERRRSAGQPDDLATLIYTSGTTGEPKGVMLTQSNYAEAMRIH